MMQLASCTLMHALSSSVHQILMNENNLVCYPRYLEQLLLIAQHACVAYKGHVPNLLQRGRYSRPILSPMKPMLIIPQIMPAAWLNSSVLQPMSMNGNDGPSMAPIKVYTSCDGQECSHVYTCYDIGILLINRQCYLHINRSGSCMHSLWYQAWLFDRVTISPKRYRPWLHTNDL